MFEEEYDSYDAIPAAVRHLYVKSGEKYVLMSAGQLRTQEDVDRLQESLRKEREDHKAAKKALGAYQAIGDAEEVQAKLDRIEELEAAAGGKLDETKINEMVEARIKSRTAPLERELGKLKDEKTALETQLSEFSAKDRTRTIHDHIRKAAIAAKLHESAVEDALVIGERMFDVTEDGNVVTKDNVGTIPGINPEVWLTEMKRSRPHWWPTSQGVGARGGDGGNGTGNNPFSSENWNLTEQGRLVKENRAQAEQLAKAAGTTIGGPKPAPIKK